MIDLHCHLLPGVDDGPRTLEESRRMLAMAAADGVRVAVATPHQRGDLWSNLDRGPLEAGLDALRAVAPDGLELRLGAEVQVDSDLLAEVERLPASGLLTLAGSRFLLLDWEAVPVGPDPRDVVNELAVAGFRPVVAHPERLPWMAEDGRLLAELVDLGGHLQLTAGSLLGAFGRHPRACAERLLDAGLAHFVASDAHDPAARPPLLKATFDHLGQRWGEAAARRLLVDNPRAVLEDRPLEAS